MHMDTLLMLVVVMMSVLFKHSRVVYCMWTMFTQHAIIWVLPAVLHGFMPHICWPIYTQPCCMELWLGITVISTYGLYAECMIQALPHHNDGYNTDTCLTLRVETSYYTGCTATHLIQVQAEAYTCILQCWKAHQKRSLAVWRSHY